MLLIDSLTSRHFSSRQVQVQARTSGSARSAGAADPYTHTDTHTLAVQGSYSLLMEVDKNHHAAICLHQIEKAS